MGNATLSTFSPPPSPINSGQLVQGLGGWAVYKVDAVLSASEGLAFKVLRGNFLWKNPLIIHGYQF